MARHVIDRATATQLQKFGITRRIELQEGRAELLPMLFVGRVTVSDVVTLAPFLESGLIARSVYVPPWARDPQRVLSIMAFSAATQRLRLDRLDLLRFADYEDEVIADAGFGI
jgi:hypothetical protein